MLKLRRRGTASSSRIATKLHLGKMTYTFEEGGSDARYSRRQGALGDDAHRFAGSAWIHDHHRSLPPLRRACGSFRPASRKRFIGASPSSSANGKEFGGETIRCSSPSVPARQHAGMMDTVLNLGLNNRRAALVVLTKNDKFAWMRTGASLCDVRDRRTRHEARLFGGHRTLRGQGASGPTPNSALAFAT